MQISYIIRDAGPHRTPRLAKGADRTLFVRNTSRWRTRTLEALIDANADALTKFKPHECENYLDNSGYRHRP